MFPAVCHQFAHAMGRNTLIPSASVDESSRIVPLKVSVKRKRRKWAFFHKIEYSVYDFPLMDLLIDRTPLESPIKDSPFCSYNPESTYSLSGKFGADIMKDIVDASLSASDKVTITAKLGELLLRQVENPDGFMSELMSRQLDMKHPLIKQITKDKEAVLCVIRGVIQTTDKAEIKRSDNTDGNIKVGEKIKGDIDIESNAQTSNVKDIVIEKGTALAYKVWELKVNTSNGSIVPMLTAGLSGGFSSMDAPGGDKSDGERPDPAEAVKHLEDLLNAIQKMNVLDCQQIRSAILKLVTCPTDIVLLSKLIADAESGSLKEDKTLLDNQFIQKEACWSLLKYAGINTGGKTIQHEGKTTPVLTAISHVIDAMSEIGEKELESVCHCSQEQIKVLCNIFKSALLSNMPITVDVDMADVFEEPISSFLKNLDFKVYQEDNTIFPPKEKTCSIECIFCVLHCLV